MVFRANPMSASALASDGVDNAGLETLYRSYHEAVRRYVARTFGPGPPDPEDVVQIVFEKFAVVEDRGGIDNPKAFLIRSARNYVIDQRRRQAVRIGHAVHETQTAESHDDRDAERVLLAKERLAIIDRTIRAMDARRQEILVMNRIHGISCADIARHLGRSPTLVKMLLAEALLLCERALREVDGEA